MWPLLRTQFWFSLFWIGSQNVEKHTEKGIFSKLLLKWKYTIMQFPRNTQIFKFFSFKKKFSSLLFKTWEPFGPLAAWIRVKLIWKRRVESTLNKTFDKLHFRVVLHLLERIMYQKWKPQSHVNPSLHVRWGSSWQEWMGFRCGFHPPPFPFWNSMWSIRMSKQKDFLRIKNKMNRNPRINHYTFHTIHFLYIPMKYYVF